MDLMWKRQEGGTAKENIETRLRENKKNEIVMAQKAVDSRKTFHWKEHGKTTQEITWDLKWTKKGTDITAGALQTGV